MIHKLDVQNHVMNTTRMIFSYDVQTTKEYDRKMEDRKYEAGEGKKREKKETSAPETSTKKGQFEGY